MMKNDILNLKCIDITVDFYGVCKHDGLVIFVKGLIPEEEARIRIVKIKNRIAYGKIEDIIHKSKYRINETCSIAHKCGGCDLQHIDYNYQLSLKKQLIENSISHTDLGINVLDVIPSKNIYSYRNKIQVPVGNNKIGYYRNHSNDIVEFRECNIANALSNKILFDIKKHIINYSLSNTIRHIVIRSATDGLMICLVSYTYDIPHINELVNDLVYKYQEITSFMVNINTKDTNVIYGDDEKCLYGNEYILDKVNDLYYMIPLRSFYQINSDQMINLYDSIIKIGGLNKDDNVLDLFCGIGTISLYIAKHVNKVLGIEIVSKSIEYANKNKKINNIKNVSFIETDANRISNYINQFNTIVLDPPRKGIDSYLINTILDSEISKIIYVSCNQATLIRDLELLKDKYYINDIQPVDMFPQTKHVECVVGMQRKDNK